MSVQVIATGEVVEPLTRVEAERLTARIADKLDGIADNYEQVMPLIRDALTLGAHTALGYPSITAYVSERFKGALVRLPRDLRVPFVAELSAAGMSTRAIAPVVGVSKSQAAEDIRGVQNWTPALNAETGEVSDDYPSPDTGGEVVPPAEAATTTDDAVEDAPGERVEHPPSAPRRPVTGLDGKTYTRPEPRTPPRRSLVDDARDAGQELRKAVDRLERLRGDDRFTRNKDEVAAHLRHHLDRAIQVCQDLDRTINH